MLKKIFTSSKKDNPPLPRFAANPVNQAENKKVISEALRPKFRWRQEDIKKMVNGETFVDENTLVAAGYWRDLLERYLLFVQPGFFDEIFCFLKAVDEYRNDGGLAKANVILDAFRIGEKNIVINLYGPPVQRLKSAITKWSQEAPSERKPNLFDEAYMTIQKDLLNTVTQGGTPIYYQALKDLWETEAVQVGTTPQGVESEEEQHLHMAKEGHRAQQFRHEKITPSWKRAMASDEARRNRAADGDQPTTKTPEVNMPITPGGRILQGAVRVLPPHIPPTQPSSMSTGKTKVAQTPMRLAESQVKSLTGQDPSQLSANKSLVVIRGEQYIFRARFTGAREPEYLFSKLQSK